MKQPIQQINQNRISTLPLLLVLTILLLFVGSIYFITQNHYQITIQVFQSKDVQRFLINIFRYCSFFNKMINKTTIQKQDVVNQPNFADMFGGATILMKNHEARSVRNILTGEDDKYMYMERNLPIFFVIGLKQEIAVSKIAIKSRQMYSSIVKHFTVQGSFTFPTQNWTHLGTFKAKNTFSQQYFNLTKKVVRYIKVTITTTYGSWMYFSLTQVKVFGDGIFADALKQVTTIPRKKQLNMQSSNQIMKFNVSFIQQALGQTIRDPQKQSTQKQSKYCPNDVQSRLFNRQQSKQKHQNIIVSLLSKIQQLQQINQQSLQKQQIFQSKYNDLIYNYHTAMKKSSLLQNEMLYRIQRMQQNLGNNSPTKSFTLYILLGAVFFLLVVLALAHLPQSSNTKAPRRHNSLKGNFIESQQIQN